MRSSLLGGRPRATCGRRRRRHSPKSAQECGVRVEASQPLCRRSFECRSYERYIHTVRLGRSDCVPPARPRRGAAPAPTSRAPMMDGRGECRAERRVISRQVDDERRRAVSRDGERERRCLGRLPQRGPRERGGARNRNSEVVRHKSHDSHPSRLGRRVLEASPEGAGGVLDPFLVSADSRREL